MEIVWGDCAPPPPENATGSFVEVAPRLPVMIFFDEPDEALRWLAPGMPVEARITTTSPPILAQVVIQKVESPDSKEAPARKPRLSSHTRNRDAKDDLGNPTGSRRWNRCYDLAIFEARVLHSERASISVARNSCPPSCHRTVVSAPWRLK
jgi:hypothetical protein